MTSEENEWYERETAAFRAWWEAGGEKTYSETPTMAAGAGWLKRAEAASSETKALSWQAEAYIKLGAVRDDMPEEHATIVQDFIGPIPEHA